MSGVELLIVLLILGALVYLIWRGVRLPSSTPGEPVCANCQYPVRGLAALRCPECGADLREVGIITPRMAMRSRPGPAGALVAWTLLTLIIAIPASLIGQAPLRAVVRSGNARLVPDSGAYQAVNLSVRSVGSPPTAVTTTLTLEGHDGAVAAMTVDPDLSYFGSTPDRSDTFAGAPFDSEALRSWMAACLGDEHESLTGEARSLAAIVGAARSTASVPQAVYGFTISSFGSGSMAQAPGWYWPAAITAWAVLWAAGCWLILRGRRARARD